jgi:hypothetical protein
MMLFGQEPNANVDGAPIVNGVTDVIKVVEMALKLKHLGVADASAKPDCGMRLATDAQRLDEYLSHG